LRVRRAQMESNLDLSFALRLYVESGCPPEYMEKRKSFHGVQHNRYGKRVPVSNTVPASLHCNDGRLMQQDPGVGKKDPGTVNSPTRGHEIEGQGLGGANGTVDRTCPVGRGRPPGRHWLPPKAGWDPLNAKRGGWN
jgi:hypothetical protein